MIAIDPQLDHIIRRIDGKVSYRGSDPVDVDVRQGHLVLLRRAYGVERERADALATQLAEAQAALDTMRREYGEALRRDNDTLASMQAALDAERKRAERLEPGWAADHAEVYHLAWLCGWTPEDDVSAPAFLYRALVEERGARERAEAGAAAMRGALDVAAEAIDDACAGTAATWVRDRLDPIDDLIREALKDDAGVALLADRDAAHSALSAIAHAHAHALGEPETPFAAPPLGERILSAVAVLQHERNAARRDMDCYERDARAAIKVACEVRDEARAEAERLRGRVAALSSTAVRLVEEISPTELLDPASRRALSALRLALEANAPPALIPAAPRPEAAPDVPTLLREETARAYDGADTTGPAVVGGLVGSVVAPRPEPPREAPTLSGLAEVERRHAADARTLGLDGHCRRCRDIGWVRGYCPCPAGAALQARDDAAFASAPQARDDAAFASAPQARDDAAFASAPPGLTQCESCGSLCPGPAVDDEAMRRVVEAARALRLKRKSRRADAFRKALAALDAARAGVAACEVRR